MDIGNQIRVITVEDAGTDDEAASAPARIESAVRAAAPRPEPRIRTREEASKC